MLFFSIIHRRMQCILNVLPDSTSRARTLSFRSGEKPHLGDVGWFLGGLTGRPGEPLARVFLRIWSTCSRKVWISGLINLFDTLVRIASWRGRPHPPTQWGLLWVVSTPWHCLIMTSMIPFRASMRWVTSTNDATPGSAFECKLRTLVRCEVLPGERAAGETLRNSLTTWCR